MSLNYIISHDNVISAFVDGEAIIVPADHPNYKEIIQSLNDKDSARFKVLSQPIKEVKTYISQDENTSINIEIKDDMVYFNGEVLNNTMTERIIQFMREGKPYQPIVEFLKNILLNPSYRALNKLYSFLENEHLPLTEDGCFLGYKRVRSDWKDFYSGTVDYSIGSTPKMERNKVDDSPTPCSEGLHVGTTKYLSTFRAGDGRVLIVKVNPKDVIGIPDGCPDKIRCCEMEVLYEIDELKGLPNLLYSDKGKEDHREYKDYSYREEEDNYDDDDEDDWYDDYDYEDDDDWDDEDDTDSYHSI